MSNDPIFAVIEAHRRSHVETLAAYKHQSEVEDELVAVFRMSVREAEADLWWIAANDAAQEALRVQDDLALKLVNTRPTSPAPLHSSPIMLMPQHQRIWKFSPMSM